MIFKTYKNMKFDISNVYLKWFSCSFVLTVIAIRDSLLQANRSRQLVVSSIRNFIRCQIIAKYSSKTKGNESEIQN